MPLCLSLSDICCNMKYNFSPLTSYTISVLCAEKIAFNDDLTKVRPKKLRNGCATTPVS